MARLCIAKSEQGEESVQLLKWLDRSLVRLVMRFATYAQDDIASFRLSNEFLLYPQFMYNIRRSHKFLQNFGTSPDESIFYRQTLTRENTTNSLVMIQPALLAYHIDNEDPAQPQPVLLDISSLKNDVILLLDTYFKVIIW
jgi:protein transport protein SEC23